MAKRVLDHAAEGDVGPAPRGPRLRPAALDARLRRGRRGLHREAQAGVRGALSPGRVPARSRGGCRSSRIVAAVGLDTGHAYRDDRPIIVNRVDRREIARIACVGFAARWALRPPRRRCSRSRRRRRPRTRGTVARARGAAGAVPRPLPGRGLRRGPGEGLLRRRGPRRRAPRLDRGRPGDRGGRRRPRAVRRLRVGARLPAPPGRAARRRSRRSSSTRTTPSSCARTAASATPRDLVGRRVGIDDAPMDAPLLAMLQRAGVDLDRLQRVPNTHSASDLAAGRLDAVGLFATSARAELRALGGEPIVLAPSAYGVDFYGDALFTSEQELADHRDRVERVRRAVAARLGVRAAPPRRAGRHPAHALRAPRTGSAAATRSWPRPRRCGSTCCRTSCRWARSTARATAQMADDAGRAGLRAGLARRPLLLRAARGGRQRRLAAHRGHRRRAGAAAGRGGRGAGACGCARSCGAAPASSRGARRRTGCWPRTTRTSSRGTTPTASTATSRRPRGRCSATSPRRSSGAARTTSSTPTTCTAPARWRPSPPRGAR